MARIIIFIFFAGVGVGVAGSILLPRVAGPFIPAAFRGEAEIVEGRVAGKLLEADRLLVTLESERGSVLVTFTERIPEVDLLVATGDTLVISMPEYSPFVENPPIERVAKGAAPPAPADVSIDPTTALGETGSPEAEVPEVSPDPDPETRDPESPDPPAVPE